MAGLLLPRGSWGRVKPPPGTPLDYSSPYLDGLVLLADASASVRAELLSGKPAGTPSANVAYSANAGPYGTLAVQATANNTGGLSFPANSKQAQVVNSFTVAFIARYTGTSAFLKHLEWSFSGPNYSFPSILIYEYNAGQGATSFLDAGFAGDGDGSSGPGGYYSSDGLWHVYSITRSGTSIRYYRDGRLIATTTTSADNLYPMANALLYLYSSAQGATLIAGLWARAWTPAEHVSYAADPWQLFAPPVWRRYYIPTGGGPIERSLAGAMPAPTGTLARTAAFLRAVVGSQPTPTGVLGRTLGAVRTLTGAQPTATGTLSRTILVLRSLAGSQPTATGTLSRTYGALRALAGTNGAPSGVLARTAAAFARSLAGTNGTPSGALDYAFGLITRSVAGVMGTPSATLTQRLAALRSLTGAMPTASGVLARTAGTFARAVAGVAGAPSGTLARIYQTVRSLAGSMPTATGVLEYARDLVTRSLAGAMGAPSGAVSRQLAAFRSAAGSQPTATGILARTAGAFARGLAGAMAAATGLLTRTLSSETTAVRGTATDAAYGAAVAADSALVGATASDSEG